MAGKSRSGHHDEQPPILDDTVCTVRLALRSGLARFGPDRHDIRATGRVSQPSDDGHIDRPGHSSRSHPYEGGRDSPTDSKQVKDSNSYRANHSERAEYRGTYESAHTDADRQRLLFHYSTRNVYYERRPTTVLELRPRHFGPIRIIRLCDTKDSVGTFLLIDRWP